MKNNCSENALMRKITEVSFAMDELRLFLDTHPDCTGWDWNNGPMPWKKEARA